MTTPVRICKVVLSGLLLFVLSGLALAQFPGGGDKGKKGGGGFNFDPAEMFKKMAKDKDYILIAEQPMWWKGAMEEYAKNNNITNGKLTLDQYLKYSEERKKNPFMMPGGNPGKGGFPMGGNPIMIKPGDNPIVIKPGDPLPGKGGGQDGGFDKKGGKGGGPPGKGGAPQKVETPEEFEKRVEEETKQFFKARDHNQDGFISLDEASKTMREHFKEFDKNNDNLISFDEGKEYMRAFLKGEIGWRAEKAKLEHKGEADTEKTIDLSELDERPEVYTGTKLPANLPPWFAQLDTDKDGQIGLYEWLAAKKSVEEFKAMDRNGDGFLTPDEVLYHTQPTTASAPATSDEGDESPAVVPPMPGATLTVPVTPMGPMGNDKGKKYKDFPGGKKGGPKSDKKG